MEILVFGMLADALKSDRVHIKDVKDTNELLFKLKNLNPIFSQTNFIVAVNKKIINGNIDINKDDEIAILPPFAGG